MDSTSFLELSKRAYRNNLKLLKEEFGPDVRLSSVVKGNAYGHGIETFVPMAEQMGINHFSVFSSKEAYRVRKVIKKAEIMIMGYTDPYELDWIIDNDISFFVFDIIRVNRAIDAAKLVGKKARIHIELETGMNRTGFEEEDLPDLLELLKHNERYLEVVGLCTHYAGAESIANHVRVKNQIERYNHVYRTFFKKKFPEIVRHTACSAAAITYPETRMDMVRIGIAQYGFWPSKETYISYMTKGRLIKDPLRRIINWKSTVMSLKQVPKGDFIGYGTTYLVDHDSKIAIIPVGYSHGYSRNLSNQGRVLIHGRRVPVVGMVNMNMLAIDVTNLKNVQKGDEVVLIGKQRKLEITVGSFSDFSNQLNYELLTRLPDDINRRVAT